MRKLFTLAHRWVGLLAGLVLALLGLTGSLMVWQASLDAALNPGWFRAPASACTAPATPVATTLALLAAHAPRARAQTVVAPREPGAAYQVWEARQAETGRRTEHFIDPACGRYLGSRERGVVRLDAAHAVPLLYELHSHLLAGETGHVIAGITALLFTGLTLTGLWLSWPRTTGPRLKAWAQALKTDSSCAVAALNLGVLNDLYLGSPEEALRWYHQYQTQAAALGLGADAQVGKWITEVQRRLPKPAAPEAAPNAASAPAKETTP